MADTGSVALRNSFTHSLRFTKSLFSFFNPLTCWRCTVCSLKTALAASSSLLLFQTLHFDEVEDIHSRFQTLTMDINRSNAPYLLRLANRLFGEKSCSFLPVRWWRLWWCGGTWWENAAIFEYLWSRNISRRVSEGYWAVNISVAQVRMHFCICRHLCILPKGCYTEILFTACLVLLLSGSRGKSLV